MSQYWAMPTAATVLRYAAFTDDPAGGNLAGVVLDADGMPETAMQAIAREVGYSETAFAVRRPSGDGRGEYDVRYFTPEREVPFCGHATIAAGVAMAERDGPGTVVFHVAAGSVPVETRAAGRVMEATLTSVAPHVEDVAEEDVDAALGALGWRRSDLDEALPPRLAYAGARHLILAVRTRARLADLTYAYDDLRTVARRLDVITVALIWRQDGATFHARNLGPAVGIVEDPATGAAAAALGGYLRALGLIHPPVSIFVSQGADMGRPSRLTVDVAADRPEVRVTGAAVAVGEH